MCVPKRLMSVAILLFPVPSLAAVYINNGATSYSTIGAALIAASAGDTLNVEAGLYAESVYIDKDITIEGPDVGIATWNGAAGGETISIAGGVDVTLRGLKVRGNNSNRRAINASGGNNTLVLEEMDIDADYGGNGGAIYAADPASLNIRDSVIAGASTGNGGGLYVSGGTTNVVVIEDTTFDGSSAGTGGAIYSSGVPVTCRGCTFDGTTAIGSGGAIYATSGSLTVERSLFCDTSSGSNGGAIYGSTSSASYIRASRFVETSANDDGGAMRIQLGTWTVDNNHFVGTTSASAVLYLNSGTSTIRNNLFFTNTGYGVNRLSGTGSLSNNWFQSNTGADTNGTLTVTGSESGEPELVAWSNNGNCSDDSLWPTPLSSPLIDAGLSTLDDPDGTDSDIGAYGGPYADPEFHDSDDGDDANFFHDCDDNDGNNFPGNEEVCDESDNNCDGAVDVNAVDSDRFYQDCDGDGQGDPDSQVVSCEGPVGGPCVWMSLSEDGESAHQDCDDTEPNTYLGAEETCEPGDQNCDGDNDNGAIDAFIWYIDIDNDGYGSESVPSCNEIVPPSGAVGLSGDCDDNWSDIYPGAPDPCGDGIDQDCNGGDGDESSSIAWYADNDGDGYGDPDTFVLDCSNLAPAFSQTASDCDDTEALIHPDQAEICDGVDNDCSGVADDGPVTSWSADDDGDGYGAEGESVEASCPPSPGMVSDTSDCDDADNGVHPGADELCNGIDDDCTGGIDEGLVGTWYPDEDGDGYGSTSGEVVGGCLPEGVSVGGDCDDSDSAVHPGAEEVCNGADDDCAGGVDDLGSGKVWYEDRDGDGVGDGSRELVSACPPGEGWVEKSGDCDDSDGTVTGECDRGCGCVVGSGQMGGMVLLWVMGVYPRVRKVARD